MKELVVAGVNLTCVADSLARSELPGKACLLALLSKLLGYGIILASTIVKVPQIVLIVRNNSIRGLSVASFEMELVGYTIALSYCLFKRLPFSAFGELAFLLIQAFVLVALLYYHSPKLGAKEWTKVGIYSAVAPVLFAGKLSARLFGWLYTGQTLLFTASRIPQILENFKNKSTGQLSSATSFMNLAGCFARLFTNIQEKTPFIMVLASLLGIVTHGIIFSQILAYNLGKPPPAASKAPPSAAAAPTEERKKEL